MEENKICTIDLSEYRVKLGNNISKVFTGRDRGEEVRKKSKIDDLEKRYSTINIEIPQDIYSINPSFLEEFLVNVVSRLGKDNFMSKFHFKSLGTYDISEPLNQAVDRILKEKNALGKR